MSLNTTGPGGPPKRLWEVLADEHVAIGGRLPEGEIDPACFAAAARAADDEAGPLQSFYAHVHEEAKRGRRRSAVCFSGGGIRSATFNLGVLQRLVELNLLERFDFLSTVSGGGYLGSWLSAWISRDPNGRAGVVDALNKVSPDALIDGKDSKSDSGDISPVDPEPQQLEHLRRYSQYLTPSIGVMSVDTWTLIAIYLRNLTLNWLVLVPLLLAVLILPRLCVAVRTLGFDQLATWPLPTAAALCAAWAFAYAGIYQPSSQKRDTANPAPNPLRSDPGGQVHFLKWCLAPLLVGTVLSALFWDWSGQSPDIGMLTLMAFGVLFGVIGWACSAWVANDLAKLRELPIVILSGCCAGGALCVSTKLLLFLRPAESADAFSAAAGIYHGLSICLTAPLILTSLSVGGTLYVGLISRHRSTWEWDIDREWWARFGAWVLIVTVFWFVGSALVLFGPLLLLDLHAFGQSIFASAGGVAGIVTLAGGRSEKSPATAESRTDTGKMASLVQSATKLVPVLFMALVIVAAASLASWMLTNTDISLFKFHGEDHLRGLANAQFGRTLAWIVCLSVLAFVASRWINLNKFSLHGVYRDRIVRCYLGASRAAASQPDPFTGFDREDNFSIYKLNPILIRDSDSIGLEFIKALAAAVRHDGQPPKHVSWIACYLTSDTRAALDGMGTGRLTDANRRLLIRDLNRILIEEHLAEQPAFDDFSPRPADNLGQSVASLRANIRLRNRLILQAAFPGQIPTLTQSRLDSARPLHVVNIALNLVHSDNMAWQERKAESFIVSPLHSGTSTLGYRNSFRYGGANGITLGTAITISGAAASPNMGYNTSKPLSFLMTLFNVRLGAWLGNPGKHGQSVFAEPCPQSGIVPLVAEAFGLTDERHKYVYLSDGGHFENLGIYEMVRRRCHWIVVGDGGCDPQGTFEDLGNAVRKIRIDMGIAITFLNDINVTVHSDLHPETARYCAIGQIHYKGVDGEDAVDGYVLYIKPAFHGTKEPADVYSYAKVSPPFPHQPTADQFFSESQFESYRMLGYHVASEFSCGKNSPESLAELFDCAGNYLGIDRETPWSKTAFAKSTSVAPLKGRRVMTVADPATNIAQRQAWTLDALDVLPQEKLDALFADAVQRPPARPAGPMPDGDAIGIAVVGCTPFWRRSIAWFVRRHAWQGKVFTRRDDDNATLLNKITALGVKKIQARIYRGPSRFEGKECIVLDYSKTSFVAKKIRDEIREVSPGVYLGVVYWGESNKRLVNFALDFNEAGSRL